VLCSGSLWQSQSKVAYPTSWWRQFSALVSRELAGMTRNPFDVAARWALGQTNPTRTAPPR